MDSQCPAGYHKNLVWSCCVLLCYTHMIVHNVHNDSLPILPLLHWSNLMIISVSAKQSLTRWGRVTHICVSKLAIVVSNNDLSHSRHQAIVWTSAGIMWIVSFGTHSEILIEIQIFLFKIWRCRLRYSGHFVSASMCNEMIWVDSMDTTPQQGVNRVHNFFNAVNIWSMRRNAGRLSLVIWR